MRLCDIGTPWGHDRCFASSDFHTSRGRHVHLKRYDPGHTFGPRSNLQQLFPCPCPEAGSTAGPRWSRLSLRSFAKEALPFPWLRRPERVVPTSSGARTTERSRRTRTDRGFLGSPGVIDWPLAALAFNGARYSLRVRPTIAGLPDWFPTNHVCAGRDPDPDLGAGTEYRTKFAGFYFAVQVLNVNSQCTSNHFLVNSVVNLCGPIDDPKPIVELFFFFRLLLLLLRFLRPPLVRQFHWHFLGHW